MLLINIPSSIPYILVVDKSCENNVDVTDRVKHGDSYRQLNMTGILIGGL